jgi:hypothetical protein
MRRSKYSYKLNKLLSLLTHQEQDAFKAFVQFSPSYSAIQAWFGERNLKISINAISHWWSATQPSLEEIKIVNAFADHLDVKDFQRLHTSALKLAVMVINILDAHISGKLASADPEFLVQRQREA